MDDEFPIGLLAFDSDFEYSESCSFCADFSLDVWSFLLMEKNFFAFSLQLNSMHVYIFVI